MTPRYHPSNKTTRHLPNDVIIRTAAAVVRVHPHPTRLLLLHHPILHRRKRVCINENRKIKRVEGVLRKDPRKVTAPNTMVVEEKENHPFLLHRHHHHLRTHHRPHPILVLPVRLPNHPKHTIVIKEKLFLK
jgi:hypothetical protein